MAIASPKLLLHVMDHYTFYILLNLMWTFELIIKLQLTAMVSKSIKSKKQTHTQGVFEAFWGKSYKIISKWLNSFSACTVFKKMHFMATGLKLSKISEVVTWPCNKGNQWWRETWHISTLCELLLALFSLFQSKMSPCSTLKPGTPHIRTSGHVVAAGQTEQWNYSNSMPTRGFILWHPTYLAACLLRYWFKIAFFATQGDWG